MNKSTLFLLLFAVLLQTNLFAQNQNISINETGALPDNSAILDVASQTKGILIPRMTSSQRSQVQNPATGLLVYDTNENSFWYYNGNQWTEIGGSVQSGGTISDFSWTDNTNLLRITENGTDWDITLNNEADDLSDNIINDLSDVNASPATGQVLKWDGTDWVAGNDESGSGGATISGFSWNDNTNILKITEGTTEWDILLDNEADDLSDNAINDLVDVDANPTNGQILQWDGSTWVAADAASGGAEILNDLNDVNTTPANGDFLQWDGTEWVAGSPSAAGCTSLQDAYDCESPGAGRSILANNGAVEVSITNDAGGNKAFTGISSIQNSFAISAEHSGTGVAFGAGTTNAANPYSTLQVTTNASDNTVSAILGSTTGGAWGVTGQVEAGANATAGVHGNNLRTTGGHGVYGMGVNGVVGETNYLQGYGVYGLNHASTGSGDGPGVYGIGSTGVYGQTENGAAFGVYGENLSTSGTTNNVGVAGWGWVGVFGQSDGTGFGVYADGELGASGTKSFMIDHPTDPENKLLKHFAAESPEVLNIYRGNIVLNEKGEATVELPEYFDEINVNFSYYLSPIGGAAPELHVKEEIKGNSFVISGGKSNLKVSWVVYAERNDAYMRAYPHAKQVEIEKRQAGKYIRPELYGQPKEKGMFYREHKKLRTPELPSKQKKQNILKQN